MWEQDSEIYKWYANDKEDIEIENLETKRSHTAKTFSKLRIKSPFLFYTERNYILWFHPVITQMTVFYI